MPDLIGIKLVIFDKDGTLIRQYGRRPANSEREQILLPGVAERIAELRALGIKVAIASNQGGVAWGFISYERAAALVYDCSVKIGGADAWRVCPFDPRAEQKFPDGFYAQESADRKPSPGMLLSIMEELGVASDETLMVGDMEAEDKGAADACGCYFAYAAEFFALEPVNG